MALSHRRWPIRKIKLICLFVLLLSFFYYADRTINYVISHALESKQHNMGVQILNTAMQHILEDPQHHNTEFITIHYHEDQSVSTIQTNVTAINTLQVSLTQDILQRLNNMETQTMHIPLGSLTNFQLLQGRGGKLTFKFYPGGYMNTKIISQFTEAGLNQTKHRILIELSADIYCVGILSKYTSRVYQEYVLSETIIVGNVPESYGKVLFENQSKILPP